MLTSEFFNDLKLSPVSSLLAILITAIGLISLFFVLVLYLTDSRIEKHNNNYKDIYRIETSFNLPNGDEVKSAQIPFPLISVLKNDKDIKSIDYIVRIFTNLHVNDKTYSNIDIYAISTDFFNTLNPYQQKNLYLTQNEIIITPEFNQQYLHLDNPQGHVITLGDKGQFLIKDVVEFNPSSRFKTAAVIAFAPEILDGYHDKRHDWYDTHAYAFITMKSGMSPTPEQLNSHVIQHAPQLAGAPFSPEEFIQLSARNIADIHYDNALPDEISTVVSSSYLNILYASGIFIIFATTMNFFNINNVINTKKRNSFYIKKTVGASNFQLITEEFFIATFQTGFVLLVALFILMSLVQFSDSARELIFTHGSYDFSTALSITTVLTYAAILLAHYLFLLTLTLPNNTYSHNIAIAAQSSQSLYMTRIMFCMQIIIAGIIIYLWAGIMTQMHFMKNYNFGYEKENIITFILSDKLKSKTAINNLQDELRNAVGINNISLSSWRPFDMSRHNISVFHNNQQEKDKLLTVNILKVNKNFINTWGVNILAGEKNLLLPSDNSNVYHAVATKSFMTLMGQQSYDHILNTVFYINENNSQQSVRVLNVIDDFYLADREDTPPPLLILIQNSPQRYGAVKLENIQDFGKVEKILKHHHVNTEHIKSINKLHKEYFSNNILMYNTINTVTLFTVILVLISTIIISTSETKRLEKTLAIMESIGGSIYTHIIFFIQQSIIPIVIAVIISLPVSFLLLHNWLSQYSVIKGLSYVYAAGSFISFILCVIIVMTITLIFNSHILNSQKKK
ncbi:TPA: darobactin export ABC transporter permease subunit [Yersinia enterocolitica]|uniref:darobactin export ABC transporter permease subunit n=1 Tax=Yersinia enterocolitica TaxID=630 RepID=UPI0005E15B94|nr:darobactin export ABC transporter permease subunit [Yersinia enterocolitica]EKN5930729.1 ABC transporter permease [Yersinia enterocolitica]EKN6381878.1 ABC transporter permease [Yersinia enterocolitica]CFQ72292.1 Membrane protein [Yersinia enterocolitica]HDL7160746.1 darobactin export ABC transporter permease subunit [Yersinia enterocolitica]HDL7623735.1 darobactin export ABC transporter permease subunit [Yersinia enterocolitica]